MTLPRRCPRRSVAIGLVFVVALALGVFTLGSVAALIAVCVLVLDLFELLGMLGPVLLILLLLGLAVLDEVVDRRPDRDQEQEYQADVKEEIDQAENELDYRTASGPRPPAYLDEPTQVEELLRFISS